MSSQGGRQNTTGKRPKTFAQRGVAIPFTTRILSYARYRYNKGATDVLVPGLGGGNNLYVIPFSTLPGVFSMSVFDRALHEQLTDMGDIDPILMRKIALDVSETGLGGPVPMRRARRWHEREAKLRNQILLDLLMSAIKQLAEKNSIAHELSESDLMTPGGLMTAKNALEDFANRAYTDVDEIISRIETWADMMLLVGASSGDGFDGPLAITTRQLDQLANDLGQWLIPEPPETAEMAQKTINAIRVVSLESYNLLDRLQSAMQDMSEPLFNWSTAEGVIYRRVNRLAWILDGWQRILDIWNAAQLVDRHQQRNMLECFAQHIPIMPAEIPGNDDLWSNLRASQVRWTRQAQNRLDTNIDQDTRERLGDFQQEMA